MEHSKAVISLLSLIPQMYKLAYKLWTGTRIFSSAFTSLCVYTFATILTMSAEPTGELEQQIEPEVVPTRNYTCTWEKNRWWYIARYSKDYKYCYGNTQDLSAQAFRTRRSHSGYVWETQKKWTQALRTSIGNSDDVGAFLNLTNSYLLVCDEEESDNFCKVAQDDLPDIPVVKTSLAGCRVIGRMCVGNKNGLIVPETTSDIELQHLKRELPDSVEVRTLEDRLSALGNVIVCNDHVALVHPDLDKESEEIVADTLKVEVFRHLIANNSLVGSYCVINNHGGLVHIDASKTELEDLSSLLQLQLIAGTVNGGNKTVASGLVANDCIAYAGMKTTGKEFVSIETALHFPIHKCS
ncbi:eukaryotic translation initiation factor 6-like isoform X2 [Zophobas morio]|uniref:eukaryotic translation initiation factor 6-like isoform X2 n=1 Tax=Zophobas morio TaxID=2755281 RepID=UPI003082CB2B